MISSGYGCGKHGGREAFHAEICACLHAVQRAADFGDSESDLGNERFDGDSGGELISLIGARRAVLYGN